MTTGRAVDRAGTVLAYSSMASFKTIPADVAAVFDAMPDQARRRLLEVRAQIFEVAEATGAGDLTETLKWGEPAYLTEARKSGTTIRLGLSDGQPAVFFTCHTSLVDGFRADFPEAFEYVGNRALRLKADSDRAALGICLGRALTYQRDKRRGTG